MRRRRFRQTSVFSFSNLTIHTLLESTLNDTGRAKIYSVFSVRTSLFESEVTCIHMCKNRQLGLVFLTF